MRIRIRFTKLGRVRWTSHRDVARMWERALRRGRVPLAYTAGFTPRPQLSFGLALPTGCESVAEYLDVALTAELDPATVAGRVGALLPEGVDVDAAAVLDPGARSLQEDVTACAWDIDVPTLSGAELDSACRRALEAPSLPVRRERKGRVVTDDLRPSVRALAARPGSPGARLVAELATQPRGVRPSELALALGVELGLARRTCQWIERDGSRWEPLSAGVIAAAEVHAS
ncbi:MAG TPA: TIGR03936 family radical SAM-associated protein [Acidimicrobiales bacterium]|nr:TIGR03936 family radical SAM-associated protein [Acidimicrobiales bacterium]